MRSEPSPGAAAFFRGPGPVLLLAGSLALCAYLWTAIERAHAADHPAILMVLLFAAALPLLFPTAGALGVFFIIPFFGNFAGGRYMEVVGIPLAAGLLGLVLRARRRGLPPPRGLLWSASLLLLFTAALALLPTLPGIGVRLAQIDFLPAAVVETLSARETDPLYSLASLLSVFLSMAWAYAIAWSDLGLSFARKALWSVAGSFILVMLLGALDLHDQIDLQASYLRPIDPRSLSYEGFQSIFWNPSWFSFYFVMAFGLVAGLLWTERPLGRALIGSVLAASYVYSFANPQRGAFLALHAMLFAALAALALGSRRKGRNALRVAAGLLVAAALAYAAWRVVPEPEWRGRALERLFDPQETDFVRKSLTKTAVRMWREFPLFGIGEGAFAWRYGEYVPLGADPYTDAASGDAHNTYLHVLATRGLFGLGAYLIFLALLLRNVIRAFRQAPLARGIALAVFFSLVGFLTYSFVQHLIYLHAIQVLFWGIVALAAIAAPREEETRAARPGTRWAIAVAGLVLLGLQLASSWRGLDEAAARSVLQPRGFSGVEVWAGREPMRWSSRRGTLCLYPTQPVANLRFLGVHSDLWAHPVSVSLKANGQLLDRFTIKNAEFAKRSYDLSRFGRPRLHAPKVPFGECVAAANPIRLTVEVSRTWSPFSDEVGADTRHLGVAVFEPTFSAAPVKQE